jgi:hypothetical protein
MKIGYRLTKSGKSGEKKPGFEPFDARGRGRVD